MHELGIAMEVVEAVTARCGGARVRRVELEVGRLSAVLPDALRFCFDSAAEGTLLEGAELAVLEIPGVARCRACGARLELDRPFGRCDCGGTDLDWLSGEELKIRAIEVA